MEPATLSLLELGFTLAGKLLDFLSRSPAGEESGRRHLDVAHLQQYIQGSADELEETIHAAARTILDKLEQDQLELLLSRTRNLSALVAMNRQEQALHYAMTLRESVDYAQNRLREDKLHWLGPYLAGNSVFLACLQYAGAPSPLEIERFQNAVRDAKVAILDQAVPVMLGSGYRIPWLEIVQFVQGESTGVLPELLSYVDPESAPGSQRAAKSPSVARAGEHLDATIHALAKRLFTGVSKAYVSPNIPGGKLGGAAKKILPHAEPGDKLIALIDCTLWGGNKDGVGIYSTYFIFADMWEDGQRFEFIDLPDEIRADDSKVVIGSKTLQLLHEPTAAAFAGFLCEVRNQLTY